MTERMYLFLCEDLHAGPTGHQPDERLETLIVPWHEALAMVDDGQNRRRQDHDRTDNLRPHRRPTRCRQVSTR